MVTSSQLNMLREKFPRYQLIFCGDIGYQFGLIIINQKSVKGLNPEADFDEIIEYTTNYQAGGDPRLMTLVGGMRSIIKDYGGIEALIEYVGKFIKNITMDEVLKTYTKEDMQWRGRVPSKIISLHERRDPRRDVEGNSGSRRSSEVCAGPNAVLHYVLRAG